MNLLPPKAQRVCSIPPEMGDPKASPALRGSLVSCSRGTGWDQGDRLGTRGTAHGGVHGGEGAEVAFDQVTPWQKGERKLEYVIL